MPTIYRAVRASCQNQKDATFKSKIFKQCQEIIAVPGFIETLRNNQKIDLAFEFDDEQPDIDKRMIMLEVPVCRIHSSFERGGRCV